jgi:2-polyprenyl-6-methoxyphenol hydroxylase-like FAD-dependent oxidoreductase
MNHEPVPPVVPDAKPDVVIIGAGPAGMMLAYLLVTNGISVRVLERHPTSSASSAAKASSLQ